ncbi:glycosyltransferase [Leucobacter sp. USHLN153]|uniref:glycosyltransferase n=1 Tax=Leucobacter sp. USHLN153 TaxID=3081268 RepID=UPI00301780B6
MRIALVSLHTSPGAVAGRGDGGGMNVVVAAAARALARRGHEVVAITRASAEAPPGERPLDAADPHGAQLRALEVGPPTARKEELPSLLPKFSRDLERLGRFDAVHAHYWLSGLAAGPLAARCGVTPAITFHTLAALKNERLAPGDRPEPPSRLAAEQFLARHSETIAVSRNERDAVLRALGDQNRRIEIVPPGVDTTLFRPDPARTSDRLRIVVLGRVQPLKGQDLAVRAAAEIARQDPELWSRCELVVAGEPTPGAEEYAASLRDIAERAGIAGQVRFLPAQDREAAAQLLASSSVALVPSHSESFGLVALESAACGTPVVAGAHSGLLEAAPAGVAGVHVEGRDPAQWAGAVARLLRDTAARARLAESARKHALAHNWDAHASQLERIYARLRA